MSLGGELGRGYSRGGMVLMVNVKPGLENSRLVGRQD